MVNKKALWLIHYFPVQTQQFCQAGGGFDVPDSIYFFSVSFDAPFEMAEAVEIRQLDCRPFPFAQINPAKRITVTEQAIGEQWTGENKIQPDRYLYC